jgi:septal ring factor EnvC (AmiA/AmiB activator)
MNGTDASLRTSWSTLKMLGVIVLFALTLGSAVVGVALYVGSGPSREEFDRERDQSRTVIDSIKASITSVEKEQIELRLSIRALDEKLQLVDEKIQLQVSLRRIDEKLDQVLANRGRR